MMDDVDYIMVVMGVVFDFVFGEVWMWCQVEDVLVVGNCYYFLVGDDGVLFVDVGFVYGFVLMCGGFEEEELLFFVVLLQLCGCGIGCVLLQCFIDDVCEWGVYWLFFEMCRGNFVESFYCKFGFVVVGECCQYYNIFVGIWIDVIIFVCEFD